MIFQRPVHFYREAVRKGYTVCPPEQHRQAHAAHSKIPDQADCFSELRLDYFPDTLCLL